MEIWIRSQDREHLVLATDIDIDYSDKSMIMINNYYMAKYKTSERALEVLDEIQNILNLKDMYKYDREVVLKGWENALEQVKIVRQQMSVYEMPKE